MSKLKLIPNAKMQHDSLANISKIIKHNLATINVPAAEIAAIPLLTAYHKTVNIFFVKVAEVLTKIGPIDIPFKVNVSYYRSAINSALQIIQWNMWALEGTPLPPIPPLLISDIPSQSYAGNTTIPTFVTSVHWAGSPTSYTITALNPGLVFNTTTGDITGTTDAAGSSFDITITAINNQGATQSNTINITVVAKEDPFISTWETTTSDEDVILPFPDAATNITVTAVAPALLGEAAITDIVLTGSYPVITLPTATQWELTIKGNGIALTMMPSEKDKLIDVYQLGNLNWVNFNSAFKSCLAITGFRVGISDTSNVTDMSYMFSSWGTELGPELRLDLIGLNTSSVINMSRMFYNWIVINVTPDITGFNTGAVTNMSFMFWGMNTVELPVDLSNFNTANVTDMQGIIGRWESVTTPPDLTSFNTSKVTNMQNMFWGWYDIVNMPDISGFDTSAVTNMSYMFDGLYSMITPPDFSNFDTSNVTNMEVMMGGWANITTPPDLTSFNTSKVTNMRYMMQGWASITTPPDISGFDTTNVTTTQSMMEGWTSVLTPPAVGNMLLESVVTASDMMAGMQSINQPPDISNFNLLNVTSVSGMMQGWNSVTYTPETGYLAMPLVTNLNYMMAGLYSLTSTPDVGFLSGITPTTIAGLFSGLRNVVNPPDMSDLDTSNVSNMSYLFKDLGSVSGATLGNFPGIDLFDISSLQAATGMLENTSVTDIGYEKVLIAWAAQTGINPNVTFGGGSSQYVNSDAIIAKATLVDSPNNWIITDGGELTPP